MLDTGTPFSFFLNRDFVSLPNGSQIAHGSASSGQAITVRLHPGRRSIWLGDRSFETRWVHSGDLGFVAKALKAPLLGFVGVDFLKDYVFTLDYDQKIVQLRPSSSDTTAEPTSPPIATLKFRLDGQIPRIDLAVGDLKIPARLDTGASGAIVLSPSSRRFLSRSGRLTMTGEGTERRLSLNGTRYGDLSLVLTDLEDAPGSADEITLGYQFLKHYRSVWDYREMTVALYPSSAALNPSEVLGDALCRGDQ